MKRRPPPEYCPVCDADVPENAQACPNCGACYESGWKDDADDEDDGPIDYDSLDLPDEAYDSDDERTAARRRQGARQGIRPMWKVVAVVTLVVLFWCFWKWIAARIASGAH
jgi:hypothetical protein